MTQPTRLRELSSDNLYPRELVENEGKLIFISENGTQTPVGADVVVDEALDENSTNPVQNKVIKSEIDTVGNTVNTHKEDKDNPHGVTAEQVGLGNVDNTSDADKPVSTAQATAIGEAKKAGTDAQDAIDTHVGNKENPHEVTAAQVGLGNVTNESKATMFESAELTGTPTAPTAGSSVNTTQIATTAFVQAVVSEKLAASDAMFYKGTIGTSGTVTELPAVHTAGWTYKVATAGTYAGVVCEIGDLIICQTDGTDANDADWTVVQSNIDGAVVGPASSVDAHVVIFSGTGGKVVKDSGFTIGASVPADAKFTDTVYTHPTTSGNKHIPSGGSANKFLKWSADGTAVWGDIPEYASAGTAMGLVQSGGDVTIVDGVITVNDDSHNHVIANIDGLQSALDGKAASSHGTHVTYTTTAPAANGTASAGSATTVSRSDHVHPLQTTISGNAGSATKATNDSAGQAITGYIRSLSVSGKVITYTRGDGTTGTITTQDTNTTYSLSSFGITATAAELNYCDGVTSNIQTQLNGKAASSHGNHVPATQTASNKVFLRNDNTWQTVTPANIGAAAASHGTHVTFTTTVPAANGTAAVGSATTVSRSDHVHPLQTTISGNAGSATYGKRLQAPSIASTAGTTYTVATYLTLISGTLPLATQGYYTWKHSWSYAGHGLLSATLGATTHKIQLAGAHCEFIGASGGEYVLRITTATTSGSSGASFTAGATYEYNYHGSSYTPTWRIINNGIVGLSVSGKTITYTRADGTTGTITTQDTNTTYSLSSFGITATAAELNYCDGVTSNIQTQLNAKAASSHTHSNYMPIAGGTFTGAAYARANTSYTTYQLRNIALSTSAATPTGNGSILGVYS